MGRTAFAAPAIIDVELRFASGDRLVGWAEMLEYDVQPNELIGAGPSVGPPARVHVSVRGLVPTAHQPIDWLQRTAPGAASLHMLRQLYQADLIPSVFWQARFPFDKRCPACVGDFVPISGGTHKAGCWGRQLATAYDAMPAAARVG